MENIMPNILDLIAAGESAEAKDALNDLLATKAFQALDARKQEIAQSLYSNNVVDSAEKTPEENETVEIDETEYTEEE